MRVLVVLATVATVAAVAAATAGADGLPVLGIDVGSTGVTNSSAAVRYVTVTAGGSTVVEAVRRQGGQIARSQSWPGSWTIPAVAYDGTASGLSADGRTLVLIEPRTAFPRKETRLLVMRAHQFADGGLVLLHGDFSFDAISPNGSQLYLIQYTSPLDPTRYLVRRYDVRAHRLVPKPVVDPRDASEKMRGNPVSRVASADGRWAYTLYDGGGSHPFVHALDTATATARCIDLEGIPPKTNLWLLRLHLKDRGRTLAVAGGTSTFVSLDTQTLAPTSTQSGGRSWWLVLVAAAVLLVLAGAALRAAQRVQAAAILLRRARAQIRPERGRSEPSL